VVYPGCWVTGLERGSRQWYRRPMAAKHEVGALQLTVRLRGVPPPVT